MSVPMREDVYVLGCLARPLTFHSQQQRACNLIWALFAAERLKEKDEVLIIGGGVAGLTAAIAARLKGCKVDVFERQRLLHLQELNETRYVHPNVHDWPREGWENPLSDLPCLNWSVANAGIVVNQIREQWERAYKECKGAQGGLDFTQRCENVELGSQNRMPLVTCSRPLRHRTYPCVILALGFGLERTMRNVDSWLYWDNENYAQPTRGTRAMRYLVVGCGDGGLIDVLRLRINRFVHQQFTHDLFSSPKARAVAEKLAILDDQARELPPAE